MERARSPSQTSMPSFVSPSEGRSDLSLSRVARGTVSTPNGKVCRGTRYLLPAADPRDHEMEDPGDAMRSAASTVL